MKSRLVVLSLALVALLPAASFGDEHADHHPAGASSSAPSASAAAGGMGAGGGGMGAMMAGMMPPAPSGGCMGGGCGSGAAAKTPIYPSLMTLPALTPDKRAEIDGLAVQQTTEGLAKLATGSEALNAATQAGDNPAMQQAIGVMREGLDELEAGIAARRVLTEGTSPRNLALGWFKREMNLATPVPHEEARTLFGVSPFHLFTMVLLVGFALAMVAMYFFKMRRAAALFGRLEGDAKKEPPPGSSPPLAGKPGPPAPPAPPPKAPASPPPPPPASSATALTANWKGHVRVGSIIDETPSVKTFRLVPESRDGVLPFTFVPGQFLNVAFWIGGARMNRSYSISSSPLRRDYVDLTIRREPRGAVSRHILDLLQVGDAIEAGGPVGRFTFAGTEANSIVLIGAGVGITPMMSITRYLTERSWPGDIFLIYAARNPTDFIFKNEIPELQRRNPKLHVAVTMSAAEGTEWKGARGRITKDLLTETVPDLASRRIHLCGPLPMMDATKAILAELGVPPDHIKTEAFGLTKPAPAAPGTSVKPTAPATGPLVTFSKNSKSAKIRTDLQAGDSPPLQTILELSEELGIGIEYSCRVGTCGICKVKMTSGEVDMAIEDSLDADDKTKNIILACQAKPKGDVVVEA